MRFINSGGSGDDPNTLLLLKFNDFTDSSIYKRPVTLIAGGTSDTGPVGDGVSAYADFGGVTTATAKYLRVPDDGTFAALWPTQAWTIEAWVRRYYVSNPSGWAVYFQHSPLPASFGFVPFSLGLTGPSNQASFSYQTASEGDSLFFGTIGADWSHLAVQRVGDAIQFFIDGVLTHTWAMTGPFVSATGMLNIGAFSSTGNIFGANCMIDDLRVSRVIRYGGDFTPPGPHRR